MAKSYFRVTKGRVEHHLEDRETGVAFVLDYGDYSTFIDHVTTIMKVFSKVAKAVQNCEQMRLEIEEIDVIDKITRFDKTTQV